MHVGPAPRIAAPGEGPVRKGDLQAKAVKQHRPELRHLLALGDRVRGDEADLGGTALDVLARFQEPGRPARAAEALVDDADALAGPAGLERALDQAVLQAGRLPVPLDLLRRRLPEVDDGRPVTVAAGDLVRRRDRKVHGPVPSGLRAAPPIGAGPSVRSARQSAAAG
jgi:hypothetical protein